MYEFFTQFTFTSDFGSTYWLPLIIEAASVPAAKDVAQRYLTGLTASFSNERSTEPCIPVEGLRS